VKDVKKILLIKFRHHGDVLLSTPLIAACRQQFPKAKIDFLIYEESAPLLKYHPDISQLLFVQRSWRKLKLITRLKNEWDLIQKMRSNEYDLVLNLTEGDRGAIYTFLTQATYRVGVDPKGKGLFFKKYFFTHLVNFDGLMKHTVEMQLDFLRVLNIQPSYASRELKLIYQNTDIKKVEKFYREKTVVIHPVSRWMFKAIPQTTVTYLIEELIKTGVHVILTGSSDPIELQFNSQIAQAFDASFLTDLSGKLSLLELAALIDISDMVISCDSLPMHMAACYKKPLVAVFGPTSSIRWAPWRNPNAKVVEMGLSCQPCYQAGCQNKHQSDCLIFLPKEKILNEVKQFIS
jgi:heptosyltransferase-3